MVTNTVFSKYNDTVYIRAKERTALEHKKSLAFLPVGEKARVLSVESISGDIKVYMIRGAYIAIRKSDAEQILLK